MSVLYDLEMSQGAGSEHGQTIAGRFAVVRAVGAGGMATVYEVKDSATGRELALKRLHVQSDELRRQRTIELFEREFHTLAHLAHPRVVEVYDYGVDAHGPYYTMELLDGGELAAMAPLPWKRVCAIGRDVGAALSLVHSRRLVFRDLNPRNVRCTSDGIAKLIDFGAMSAMGPNRQVVGTPAYCAPEALDFEPLDVRTDLYSLGGTLYFALTGRHAFAVRTFEQKRALRDVRPQRPAELVEGVPVALDELVMELLHPEAGVRPANVAEVIERLGVIEGRTFDDVPSFTQAYLSTPTLVGRDNALKRIRDALEAAQAFRPGVLVFDGPAGMGRSRLLDACRIEAKLLGVLTLSADAGDGQRDYGVLQALTAQLLMAAPELCLRAAEPHLSTLGHALPALLEQRPGVALSAFEDGAHLRSQLFDALQAWLLAICAEQPLVITVDDAHTADEPSIALLGLLSRRRERHGLVLVFSVERDAPARAPRALQWLLSDPNLSLVRLSPLNLMELESLLRSVFGDVANIQTLTHRLYETGRGNPGDTMQLAQDLVERKIAKYRSGAWSLPSVLDASELPASMALAQRARIAAMDRRALAVAQALTLSRDRGLTFEECQILCETDSSAVMVQALSALQSAQIVRLMEDGTYAIDQRSVIAPLQETLDEHTARQLHLNLARIFARRADEEFRRVQHLYAGGQRDEALDVLVAFAVSTTEQTDDNPKAFQALVAALPEDWLELYVECLRHEREHPRKPADAHALRIRFLGLMNVMGVPSLVAQPILSELMTTLTRCSGLSDCAHADATLDPATRLRAAMGATFQRYEAEPEATRIVPVPLAIKQLVRTVIGCAGLVSSSLDHALALNIPDLAPLAPMSPAVDVADRLRTGALARVAGRVERASAVYRDLLERAAQPDRAGLDASNHRYMVYGVMTALGLMEASFGQMSCVTWAARVEDEPLYRISAFQIRMVHALWEGRVHDADKYKEEFELLRIQGGPRQLSDGPYLIGRVTANAVSDDLTRIKHTMEEISRLAERHAAWWPVHEYAVGEHDRIRGRTQRALAHLETALQLTAAGTHPIWPHAAAAHLRVLRELKQSERALPLGRQYLEMAEASQLGAHVEHVRLQLALALGDQGRLDEAAAMIDACSARYRALDCRGLALVLAYEARAQVAMCANDVSAYEAAMGALADQVSGGQGRGLRAKQERLKRAARIAALPGHQSSTETLMTSVTGTGMQLDSILHGSSLPLERAQRALQLLVHHSGASEGCLYLNVEGNLGEVARSDGWSEEEGLGVRLHTFMSTQLADNELETCTEIADDGLEGSDMTQAAWKAANGSRYICELLSHQTSYGPALTGVAVLKLSEDVAYERPAALAAALSRALADAGDVAHTGSD